jgi:hypothetical protein
VNVEAAGRPSPRLLAKALDLAIAAGLWFVPGAGLFFAVGWLLAADRIPGGSPGKRLFGLCLVRQRPDRPWSAEGRGPVWQAPTLLDSVLRNAVLAVPVAFTGLGLVGLVVGLAVLAAASAFEIWMVLNEAEGVRVGDILARTRVRGAHPVALEERLDWDPPVAPGGSGSDGPTGSHLE